MPARSGQRSPRAGVESFYFLADYHALIKTVDPARRQRSRLETAAASPFIHNLPEYGFVLQNFWNNANQHALPDPFGMVK